MVFLIFIAIVLFFGIISFNSLIGKRNQVTNVFGSVDALLRKRYDLIPNLVAAVKTYMNYEKETLSQITQMRAKAISGNISEEEKAKLDNQMGKLLGSVMVAVENYPDLKADKNFLQLQAALNEIEEQISAARRAYNAAVTDYNNAVGMFPTSIVAALLNFKAKAVFESSDEERHNVDVGQLFKK